MKLWGDSRLYSDPDYCLEYLSGLRHSPGVSLPGKRLFHAYWHGTLGAKQALSLKSCLATQDLSNAEVWLWTDGVPPGFSAAENRFLKPLAEMIRVVPFSLADLASGTVLEPTPGIRGALDWRKRALLGKKTDLVHWSNLVRYLVLNRFGGIYFDLDVLFLRDWQPLFAALPVPKFCYQWSGQKYCNTAVLALHKGDSLLGYIMKKGVRKRTFSPPRLFELEDDAVDLLMLPSAVFDPLWLHADGHTEMVNRPFDGFEDFFLPRSSPGTDVEIFFPGCFAYHWHNQWTVPELKNSWAGRFDRHFNEILRENHGILPAPAFNDRG